MRKLLLFFAVTILSSPVHAGTVADFCKDIENTNDLVACLSKYNNKAKEKLTSSFQSTFATLSSEDAVQLKKTQQNWIDYRNSECNWEVKNEPAQSLKRVRELHCMIRMTADRQETIDGYNQKLHDQNRAQGVKPRWENVLYADHSDVFWRAGKMTVTDLNCDGQLENTLLGINIDDENSHEYVIAFIENTHTGRPVPLLMDLPSTSIDDASGENIDCGKDIVFMAPTGDADCSATMLNIKNGQCGIYQVSHTDAGFSFSKKGVENSAANDTEGH